jgi:hypothetical protein
MYKQGTFGQICGGIDRLCSISSYADHQGLIQGGNIKAWLATLDSPLKNGQAQLTLMSEYYHVCPAQFDSEHP